MPIAAAIPAIIGAAGSIGGALIGSGGSKSAGKTLGNAGTAAAQGVLGATSDSEKRLEDLLGGLSPYLNLGNRSATTLADMLGPGGQLMQQFAFDPSQIANTPEYKFQLQQGTQALDQSAAARGGLLSGGQLKGITQYGQGLASTSYQQAYNNALNTFQTNRNNTLGALLAGTGIGQQAFGQNLQGTEFEGSLAQTGALGAGNFFMQGAGGTAAGQVGSANAWQGALPGLVGAGTTLAGLIPGVTPVLGPGADWNNVPGGGPVPGLPGMTPTPPPYVPPAPPSLTPFNLQEGGMGRYIPPAPTYAVAGA